MMGLPSFATALIPPSDPNPEVTKFRWFIWVAVVTLLAVVSWMLSEMATASETEVIANEVREVKTTGLEAQIFNKSIDVCMSEGPLRLAYQQELSRLVADWRGVMRNYQATPSTLKTCFELGLANRNPPR